MGALRTPRQSWLGLVRFVAALALVAWLLRSLVVAPFTIPTGSMVPTMLPGDYLLVMKWPYGFSRYSFFHQVPSFPGRVLGRLPERGDVVIFKRPGPKPGDWVKRVIGLPGDRVEIRHGTLFLNGQKIAKEAAPPVTVPIGPNTPCKVAPGASRDIVTIDGKAECRYPAYYETLPSGRVYLTIDQVEESPGDWFGPVTVPSGSLFLMGDNRDDSMDSRFSLSQGGIGMVPTDHLVGRAAFAFWSTDGSARLARPWTWIRALRTHRIGTGYQP